MTFDMLLVDKGNKGKLQQLTDLVKRGMSAATSRANSRGPSRGVSRTPSRGTTQDLDNFEPQQPNARPSGYSQQASRKQLSDGQPLSSEPVAEGYGGAAMWKQQVSTDTHRLSGEYPRQSWLQSILRRSPHPSAGTHYSANHDAAHGSTDPDITDISDYLDILAAQPSQSASSVALLHDYSSARVTSDHQLQNEQKAADSDLQQPDRGESGFSRIYGAAGTSTHFVSSPRPVAEGTEGRPAARASQQRPGFGFMSGGGTGRSAPHAAHAATAVHANGQVERNSIGDSIPGNQQSGLPTATLQASASDM